MTERICKRGDVYYADLDQNAVGSEQYGVRPVIVLQNDKGNLFSPTVIIAIITTKHKRNMPTHVEFRNYSILKEPSVICLEQIKTIDKSRLGTYLGNAGAALMNKVNKAAVVSLGMSEGTLEDIDDVNDTEEQECVHMDMVKRKTVFDNFDNNVDGWIEVAKQQMLFFSDIQQHIINLKIEKETLDNEIECILSFIETTTYNVAQGYKVYKILRDKSSHRKKLKKEIDQLEALVGNFDCSEMRRLYQSAVGKMQHALSTYEIPDSIKELMEEAV